MFDFLKRLMTPADSGSSTVDPWALSKVEQLIDDVGVYTYDAMEYVAVDIKRRQFIWKGGKQLGITQVADQLHQANSDMPLELIEDAVMEWLTEASMSDNLDDGDAEDEWIHQTETWVEAHSKKKDALVYD